MGTKDRILAAAEQLFVERGFAGTSLRAVTGAADVNLAAVHYHFGSKEGLLRAVLDRHVGPMNRQRLERLDALERSGIRPGHSARSIVAAFIEPALRREIVDPQRTRSLLARIYGEPPHLVGPLLREEFGEVTRRFLDALGRALPEVPRQQLGWRFQLVLGALLHVVSGNSALALEVWGIRAPESVDEMVGAMLAFVTAGLEAPLPATAPEPMVGASEVVR